MKLEELFLENLDIEDKVRKIQELKNDGYEFAFPATSHPIPGEIGQSEDEISFELIKKYETNNIHAIKVCISKVKRFNYMQSYYRIYVEYMLKEKKLTKEIYLLAIRLLNQSRQQLCLDCLLHPDC